MEYHKAIYTLKNRVHNDLADIREVVKMAEAHLHRERVRLASHVKKELRGMSPEEKEYTTGWYMNDFARLDKVYPNIQRRALFTTLMCITEANLLLACDMCHRAFELPSQFKAKERKRV